MRISYRWLTELLPGLSLTADELAERLTALGLVVEEIVRADRGFDSVVLGRVVEVASHPAAERLKLCTVEGGAGEMRRVVCGAPVVEVGAFYPLALPGARLPAGKAIETTEIRGVRSEGMLCSAPELGLDHLGEAGGILRVDAGGAAPGSPVAPLLGMDDTIFVLELPSNRPDWESHLGVARELRELAGGTLRLPPALDGSGALSASAGGGGPVAGRRSPRAEARPAEGAAAGVRVRIEDREGCPRYTGGVVRGVVVGPAPLAAQQRLALLGLRPVNNVVDATNYVLLEAGTPLHAFDLALLAGGEVVVRRASVGETLETLDGRQRALDPAMTVIADRDRAIAIGGVMGGRATEVSGITREVFLEAAFFQPERVRRTASALGLRTEASHRFGRGVDARAVPAGLRRGLELIAAWAGGDVAGDTLDAGEPPPLRALALRPERVTAVTGISVSRETARAALIGIGIPVEEDREGTLRVTVPSHRFDLAREIDLVEEVVRRIGYERVPPAVLPRPAGILPRGRAEAVAELAGRLRGLGLDEAYTTTFFDPAPFGPDFYEGRLLEQSNPLAQNERFLRPAMAPTLALAARHNLRRGASGVAFFEMGHVFESGTARDGVGDPPVLPGVRERRRLGILIAGRPRPLHWSDGGQAREADFFDVKGIVEALAGQGREVAAVPSEHAWLHPGQQAELELAGSPLGFVGRLHPRVERALDLAVPVFVAELDPEPLLPRPVPGSVALISPFPRVERDVALVVPDELEAAWVRRFLEDAELANLVELRLFDVYRGEPVPAGARSLAFRLVFQSAERTLTEADVEREMERLLARLAAAGIRLR